MSSRNVRGVRAGIPSGVLIGRKGIGNRAGAATYISLTDIARTLVSSGSVGGSGGGSAPTPSPVIEIYDYATPTTGATVTMSAKSRRLVIHPAGALAALTVVLPPNPTDGQIVGVGTTNTITTLTINAGTGGASIIPPGTTTLTANGTFTMLFKNSLNTWFISP